MKILHLSNVVGKFGGGVAQVVQALLSNQFKLGRNPELWFLGNKAQETELFNTFNIQTNSLSAIENPFFRLPYFFKKLRNIGDKDVVVHQHGVFLPISLLSLTSRKHVKVIISPHGYLEPEKLKVSPIKKKLVLALFESKNLRNCHCLVACSKKEAVSLREFGLSQPIVILPNGVSDSLVRKDISIEKKSDLKQQYGIEINTKVLLFLSRIHPFKGLELFLKSILVIKDEFIKNDWLFVIAGIDELNHEAELKIFVKDNDMDSIVKFIGPQYNQDKINVFDAADCFVLPSRGENFGIAVIEALARGLPVITTTGTPWEELETDSCGWWIERTQKDFVGTILELFSKDKSDLLEMGQNGINLVARKYTWSNITLQSIHMYEWVLNDFNEEYQKGFTLLK